MMNWIVTAGNLAALRLTKRPLLLAPIEDLFFLQPVRIGDVVSVKAMVEYIGSTSLEAEAVVFCKSLNEEEKLCTRARMPFVSSVVQGRPLPIEQHIGPAGDNEMKMYQYAREIRERRFARIAQRRQRLLDTNLEDAGQLSLRVHRLVFPEDAIYGNLMYGGKLLLILDEIMADAAIHLVDQPRATVADLMRFIPGPDFPTYGIIQGRDGIRAAYERGRGTIQVRARAAIEVHPRTERESIIVSEIPYQVNKAKLVEHIAELVREKKIEGISDLRDESSREGMRIVVELKRDAVAQVVLNNLYAHTAMQTGFGVTLLAIDVGQPRILDLKALLERFVAHRRDVVTRRTRHELKQARELLFHVDEDQV